VQEGGRPLLEVRDQADVLLCTARGEEGNAMQYFGAGYLDLLMAQDSKNVICSVDRYRALEYSRHSAEV